MKIAFIRPKVRVARYIQHVPLAYVHLAAYLREKGHEPFIFDMVLEPMHHAAVDALLKLHDIKVAGIGCITFEFPEALEEAKRLKAAHPDLQIIFGGAHASSAPEECLKSGVVDYVVVGEGELALTELLNNLESGSENRPIQGVWHREDDKIISSLPAPIPDVNELPLPAYDLIDTEAYFKLESPWYFTHSNRAVQFITSRGCPYRCSYCHSIHGKRFRGQSPEKVLDQMEALIRNWGIEEFIFVDDIFNCDLERAKAICRGIISRNLKAYLQFPNGVRGDRFDEELMALMKSAGTHFIALAIETVSKKYQQLIRKNLNIEKTMQTLQWANKYGIEVSGYFMIGFPGESLDEVQETLKFAVKAPFDAIFISIVTPFKGTTLRNDMLEGRFGHLEQEAVVALNERFPFVKSETLTRDVLRRLQMNAYWRFYLRPKAIRLLIKRLVHAKNFKKAFRAIHGRISRQKHVSAN